MKIIKVKFLIHIYFLICSYKAFSQICDAKKIILIEDGTCNFAPYKIEF